MVTDTISDRLLAFDRMVAGIQCAVLQTPDLYGGTAAHSQIDRTYREMHAVATGFDASGVLAGFNAAAKGAGWNQMEESLRLINAAALGVTAGDPIGWSQRQSKPQSVTHYAPTEPPPEPDRPHWTEVGEAADE